MEVSVWFSELIEPLAREAVPLVSLLVLSAVVYAIARWWLVAGVRRIVRRTQTTWDDALVDAKVFIRLAHVAPAIVIYQGLGSIEGLPEDFVAVAQRVALAVMIVVVTASVNSLLTAINDVYSRNPEYRRRPIKGYVQLVKIAIFGLTTVAVVSVLVDRSPWLFLSGIGAMTAVVLLIFKDTILSLVASVQIASNDLLRVGDWVEMPNAGADGDVIDIALHTVKVQNWDKTITSIPTHRFIDEGFKNWRGMSRSGGRRIKRAVYIDVSSVRFLTQEEIDEFGRWELLSDYIRGKRADLSEYNVRSPENEGVRAELRQLTNVGTFRAYLLSYLRSHPKIHSTGYTLMVRQLEPGPEGLPLELYCFSNDQVWVNYEGIQGDLFDHILAILPEFGLRVFQGPTGHDLFEAARGLRVNQ